MKSPKYLIAAAAMSGLLAGASTIAFGASPVSSSARSTVSSPLGVKAQTLLDDTTKHDCKGQNACKGQGGCKAGDAGCKGKNSCKGHGGCKTNGTL